MRPFREVLGTWLSRARELLDLLSVIDASRLPRKAMSDLWTLQKRIAIMGNTSKPIMPSIEAAQKAAGVNPEKAVKQRRSKIRIA